MRNAKKRFVLAWALIAAPVLFFGIALLMGRACPGALIFWALMFVSHMPVIALPFWAVFHGYRRAGIFLGWLMFVLGESGFFLFYATYFKAYGWPSPEPPGLLFISILFGWAFGWLVVVVAETIKQKVDQRWPLIHHDSRVPQIKMNSEFPRFLSFLLCSACAFGAERRFDFSEFRENEAPSSFRSAITGRGPSGNWKVITAEVPPLVAPLSPKTPVVMKRSVLAQLSNDREETRAPLFIWDVEPFHDFTFAARFKIVSGEVEQMAGIAFRLQDEKNYYYVRANAKEQNVAFFRYVDGEIIGGVSLPAAVKKDDWNHFVVECRGTKLRALLNDREAIPWTEPNLVPFPDGTSKGVFPAGKVAFWTKADSVVYFTNARIDFAPREIFAQTLLRETMLAHPRLLSLRIFGLTTNQSGTRIIASTDEKEIGQLGDAVERNCIEKGGTYVGKGKEVMLVTMPLHDRNGETVGAVRVTMTTFFGQTEKNALARAMPIVKSMEARVSSAKELLQ